MQLTYAQGGVRFGVPEQTKKTLPVPSRVERAANTKKGQAALMMKLNWV
ncbi:MAG: hypothetical protein ROO70_08995 [Labrenzia sp.]